MNGMEFRELIRTAAPNYAVDYDNYGQVIIYTHLKEIDNDEYVQMSDSDFEENN